MSLERIGLEGSFAVAEAVKLSRTKTNSFSVDKAWEEAVVKEGLLPECKKIITLQGLVHEVGTQKLRKPTYAELEALAGLTKVEEAE